MPSLMREGLSAVFTRACERALQTLAISHSLVVTCGMQLRMRFLHMSLESPRIRHPLTAQAALLRKLFSEVNILTQTVQQCGDALSMPPHHKIRPLGQGGGFSDIVGRRTTLCGGGVRGLCTKTRAPLVTYMAQHGVHVVKRFPASPADRHSVFAICLSLYGFGVKELHTFRCGMLSRSVFTHCRLICEINTANRTRHPFQ